MVRLLAARPSAALSSFLGFGALLSVLLCTLVVAKKRRNGGWRLPHHSFERTLSYDDSLSEWVASAGSIALRDRLQINPPVADRYGFFWSKKPILTQDFEVEFTLSAVEKGEGSSEGTFAFWLSPDSVAHNYDERILTSSKDWKEGLEKAGLTLLSNKPTFRGLALTFASTRTGQVVSALWNDGKARTLSDLTSKSSGAQVKEAPWISAGTQVRVKVDPSGKVTGHMMKLDLQSYLTGSVWGFAPDGVKSSNVVTFQADGKVAWDVTTKAEGSWKLLPGGRMTFTVQETTFVVRFEGTHRAVIEEPLVEPQAALHYGARDDFGTQGNVVDWQEIFSFPAGTFGALNAKEVYMGFTSYSGAEDWTEVNIHRMETVNFDEKHAGEDDEDLLAAENRKWLETLEQEKQYVDQASQAEAVTRLTVLLNSFSERSDKEGKKLKKDVMSLEERLDSIGSDMSNYLSATKSFSFDESAFDSSILKGHIVGLRSALLEHEGPDRMSELQKAAAMLKSRSSISLSRESKAKVKAVQEQGKTVERYAKEGSSQTNIMLFILVVAVAALGCLFLNRMRYYEKKHYI
mmetsp:Transcript_1148/g.2450  ORF Transcript_1148/g.2450 Transcript_1148/m.2450 type:complete len:575 (+) Transcript_1148:71-1795(+)